MQNQVNQLCIIITIELLKLHDYLLKSVLWLALLPTKNIIDVQDL